MSEWKVYNKDGITEVCSVKALEYSGSWMGECSVTATITSPTPLSFSIGDYLEYRGERFEINYDPTVIKSATSGSYGEGFTYDNVKFNSLSDELTRCDFLDFVPSDNQIHYSSLPNFSFFAGDVRKLAERIQVNLDRIYKGNKKWTVIVSDEYNGKKDVNIAVNNITCWEALALVKSQFGANFIIKNRTITIGTEGLAVGKLFSYGKGNGLVTIERSAESNQKIITRLRAYGSTRNLPNRYYFNTGLAPNNLAVQNLMLPSFPNQTLDPYIDSENISELGVREGTVFFDGSGDLEEIYPSMEGMTAEQLKEYGVSVSATGRLDEVVGAEQIADNGIIEPSEDENATIAPFTITLKDIGFDINDYLSTAGSATISMKDGMCGGRDFEIVECVKEGNNYILTCNRSKDTSLGLFFPYSDYQIKSGDRFVLLNIEMPDVYIKAASQRLLNAAKDYLAQNDYVRYSYTPKVDNIFMARQHDEAIQYGEKSLHDTIKEGDFMLFEDSDLGIEGSIIIDTLSIKEGDGSIPQYELTLRNDKVVGTIEKLQNQIDSIAQGGSGSGEGGGYNAAQIKSIIKALGETLFLSKTKPDRTPYKLSSDKGFEAGDYVKGFLGGSGSWIGADGYGEMSGLTLREFLEVPELRFNRVDVVSGELWNAVAFGLVEEVEITGEETGILKIKLEENERCGLHVGDYCRGIFADFSGGSNWEGPDECKFLHLYGFSTSYFTPTKIIESKEGLFVCEYALKPETKQHPTKSMKFAVYGHPTDTTRQASAYATRTYKRYLNKVDTWVIDPDNHIYAQYGDLNGLVIDGVDMKGYGSYQSNAYFKGVQIQLSPEQLESLKGDSAYAAQLTNNVGTVSLDKDGNIKDGLYEESVVTASDNGVQSEVTAKDGNGNESTVTVINHKLTTAVQAYKGSTPLYYSSTATSGSFTLSLTCVGCTAFVVNGAVIVSSITDTKNCSVNISVNCEGMAVYNLVYSIVFVQDGKDGDKGESVSMFEITPGNIILNNTSSGLQPSSVKFTLWKREGSSKHEYASHWFLLGKKASETNFTYLEYANKSFQSSYSFDFSNYVSSGYRYFQVEADDSQQTLATTEISVVKDGESYDIIPNLSVIGKTMTGSIDPETVTFKLVMNGGADGLEADWCVYYGNVESELNNRTDTTKTSEFTFTFDSRYKYYRVDAKRGNDSLYSRYITVVSDGKDGSVGAMARYRGEFIYNNPDPYVYNSEYRDIVIHDGDVYQVYSLGTSITSAPTVSSDSDNDGKWQRASKFRFVAMDTALVDNANIAGFIFTREGYDGNGAPIGSIRSQAVNSTVSYSHSASWTDDGVYRKSPDIGDSGFTIETVTFSANEHCTVMVEMVASSENNFDKGYVGVLNRNYIDSSGGLSADIKSDNLLSVSGKESKVVQIEVDKGTYTLQMVYSKDSSKSENEDCVRYRFIGSPKLYLSSYTGTLICSDVNLTGVINANGGTFKNVNIESANITGSISVERDKYKMFISPSEAEGNPGLSWSYDETAYTRLGLWYYNGYVSGSLFVSNNGTLEESASILPNRIGVVGKRLIGDARYYETLVEGGGISMTGPFTTVSASLGVDGEGRFRIYSPYWPLEKAAGTNEMYVDGDGYVKVKSPSRK